MGKGSFILYDVDLNSVGFLTENQAGKLFLSLAKYRLCGVEPDFSDDIALKILFHQISEHIAINEEKYKEACAKKSEAAKKRWNKNDANECSIMQMQKSECIYDTETETETDTANVTVTDNTTDACGAKRENKRKNYYSKKTPFAYEGEPSYDIDAFLRKAVGLKYEKKGTPLQDAPL